MIPNDWLTQIWDRIRTNLWFVPGLQVALASMLAGGIPHLEQLLPGGWNESLPLVFSGSVDSAQTVLATIATSMITLAGVVFSITLVALQLTSSQFGPRLLRTFLRDRTNQFVLGMFLSTSVYCLMLLPQVNQTLDPEFVPSAGVTVAMLFAIGSLAALVYFIDHVAQSIHADAVIAAVGVELSETIDSIFPPARDADDSTAFDDVEVTGEADNDTSDWTIVRAQMSGYVRYVSKDVLVALACEHASAMAITVAPGQYVIEEAPILRVSKLPADEELFIQRVQSAVVLGPHRTTLQDVAFAFEQLSEMAGRALSPGLNDPTTAAHCVDRIGSGLVHMLRRSPPAHLCTDDDQVVRLHLEPVRLSHILDVAIGPIVRSAGCHLTVWVRLIEIIRSAELTARADHDRRILSARFGEVLERAIEQLPSPVEREKLNTLAAELRTSDAL